SPPPPDKAMELKSLYDSRTKSASTVTYSLNTSVGNNGTWMQKKYSNFECGFTPGPYHLQSYVFGGKSYFCYGDQNLSFGDFIYTVQATVVHGDGSIMFFRAGQEFQDFFRFEVHTDGSYRYWRGSVRGTGSSSSILQGHNVSNELGAVVRGADVAL